MFETDALRTPKGLEPPSVGEEECLEYL
jgi:hypothetical protein